MGYYNRREFAKLARRRGHQLFLCQRTKVDPVSPLPDSTLTAWGLPPDRNPDAHGIEDRYQCCYRPLVGHVQTRKRSLIVVNNPNSKIDDREAIAYIQAYNFCPDDITATTLLYYSGRHYQMELVASHGDRSGDFVFEYKLRPTQIGMDASKNN